MGASPSSRSFFHSEMEIPLSWHLAILYTLISLLLLMMQVSQRDCYPSYRCYEGRVIPKALRWFLRSASQCVDRLRKVYDPTYKILSLVVVLQLIRWVWIICLMYTLTPLFVGLMYAQVVQLRIFQLRTDVASSLPFLSIRVSRLSLKEIFFEVVIFPDAAIKMRNTLLLSTLQDHGLSISSGAVVFTSGSLF